MQSSKLGAQNKKIKKTAPLQNFIDQRHAGHSENPNLNVGGRWELR